MSFVDDGEYSLQMNDFGRARQCFGYARRENRNDWRAWYGLAKVVTKKFTAYTGENWALFVATAKGLTTPENRELIDQEMGDYAERIRLYKNMRSGRTL